jgi:CHAT domain-containing protein/tetratricopeptide (TPR) repeat protein
MVRFFLLVSAEFPLTLLIAVLLLVIQSFPAPARNLSAAQLYEEFTQQPSSPIGPGQSLERTLKGGEAHSFTIHVAAGQFLYVLVEQKGIDVAVALFGPGGEVVWKVDSPNANHGPEPLISIVDQSGDYRIEVSAPGNNTSVGGYEIRVAALRDATSTDKELLAADRAFWEGNRLRLQRTATSSRDAIEKYKQALPFFQASGDSYRQALTLSVIGSIYAGLGEFQTALGYHEQALLLFRAVKNDSQESSTLNNIGGMYDALGNPGKALEYYRQALELLQKGAEPATEGAILSNIGKTYNDLSNWQKALEYYNEALSVFRVAGEKRREAITLNNIGVAYSRLGEREKSLDYYQQALSLRKAIGDKPGEASTLTSIGEVYASSGDAQKALEFYREALPLRKTAGDRVGEATTLDYMGIALSSLGEREKALSYHQQALELRRVTADVRGEAHTLRSLAYVYNSSGDADKAIDYYNQSLVLFRRVGDRQNEASVLYGLARVERNAGKLLEARQHIEPALSLFEDVRANAGAEQLRASYFASNQGAYQFYIGLLMEMHQLEPAKGYDSLALQTSERARARSLVEMLAESQADIRQGVDPALLERERNLKQQLNAKAQRQIQLTGRKSGENQLAQLNKELRTLEDEYELVQADLRKRSPAYAALTQPQPLGLREIQQQLDPNTLLLEYSLGDERSYLWAVTQNSLKTYDLPKQEEVEKVARQVYESITTRSVAKSLETLAQRQARIAQADQQFQRAAIELSQMILVPAASQLGTKRVVIVADGALQYVPFAALSVASSQLSVARTNRVQRTADNGPLTNYKPLILDREVVTLPSASVLAVQRQTLANRKPGPKAVAVIADPVFSTNDARFKVSASAIAKNKSQMTSADDTRIIEHLADSSSGQLAIRRLPFTRQEAEQIVAVAPAGSSLRALDFRANRSIATSGELSKYRYVHFATHGYLDTIRPGLSAIVVSLVDEEGKPQDGFLRTYDIYNLKLPAELVVLSACETGLGKDVKGEGLVGLTRGFMYAGARRVVVSLWNVNDKATADLMHNLYRGMLSSNKTPAASLREAQIEMLRQKQWQSPYYWAAFVIQGDWN